MPDDLDQIFKKHRIAPPKENAGGFDITVPKVLDDEFAKLGYSPTARLSMLGDVGRENAWNRKTIFGGHVDPASYTNGRGKIENRGIISWNGKRRADLDDFLRKEGVYAKGDDEELRGMARFMDHEMQTRYPDVHSRLKSAANTYDASEALRHYINYDPAGPYNSFDKDFRTKNNREWAERARDAGLAQGPRALKGFEDLKRDLLGSKKAPAPMSSEPSPTFANDAPRPIGGHGAIEASAEQPVSTPPVNAPRPQPVTHVPVVRDKTPLELVRSGPGQVVEQVPVAQNPVTNEEPKHAMPGAAVQPPAAHGEETDVRSIDTPDTFKGSISFRDKPYGVSNEEWAMQQLVPKIANNLSLPTEDVEAELRKRRLIETAGHNVEEIPRDTILPFETTPDFADAVLTRADEKRNRLAGLVASGMPVDEAAKKQISDDLNIDPREVDEAFEGKGDYRYQQAISQGTIEKNRYKTLLDGYTRTLADGEPENVADLRARIKMGWINPEKAEQEIATEKDLAQRLQDEYRDAWTTRLGQYTALAQNPMAGPAIDRVIGGRSKDYVSDLLKQYGSLSEYKRQQDSIRADAKVRPYMFATEAMKTTARYLAKIPATVMEAGAMATDLSPTAVADWVIGSHHSDDFRRSLMEAAKTYREQIVDRDATLKQDPRLRNYFILNEVPEGIAQFAVQIIAAPLTGGYSLALPLAEGATAQYREADQAGAGRIVRLLSGTVGAAMAVPDVLIKAKFLRHLIPSETNTFVSRLTASLFSNFSKTMPEDAAREITSRTVKSFIASAAKQGTIGFGTEFSQEALEDVGNKALAKATYKPEITWSDFIPTEQERRGYWSAGIAGFFGGNVEAVTERMSTRELKRGDEEIAYALKEGLLNEDQARELTYAVNREMELRNSGVPSVQNIGKRILPGDKSVQSFVEKAMADRAPSETAPSTEPKGLEDLKNELISSGNETPAEIEKSPEQNRLQRNEPEITPAKTAKVEAQVTKDTTLADGNETSVAPNIRKPMKRPGGRLIGEEPKVVHAETPQIRDESGRVDDIPDENPKILQQQSDKTSTKDDNLSPSPAKPRPPVRVQGIQLKQQSQTQQGYVDQALTNLQKTSRTAQGIIDTSASPDKAAAMEMGSGDEIAKQAVLNFKEAIKYAHASSNVEWPIETARKVVDHMAETVNAGIVKPDKLAREHDSDKYAYTRTADLAKAREQFNEELSRRLSDPDADPIETAAWIEWRANITDHFWSDGVGKTSKVLAAIPLMRAGLPLPKYRDNKEFFALSPKTPIKPDPEGREYLGKDWKKFLEYYRTLFEPAATETKQVDKKLVQHYVDVYVGGGALNQETLREALADAGLSKEEIDATVADAKEQKLTRPAYRTNTKGVDRVAIEHDGFTATARMQPLAGELAKLQKEIVDRVITDPAKYVAMYLDKFPKVVNPDDAKTLFPEYNADALAGSQITHTASSLIAQFAWHKHMRDLPKGSQIMFLGGGAASGKTTAARDLFDEADLIIDRTLSDIEENGKMLYETIEYGHKPRMVLIFRPPREAAKFMLARWRTEGRIIPIKIFATGHYGAAKAFVDHTWKYVNEMLGLPTDDHARTFPSEADPVRILSVSGGKPQRISIAELESLAYNSLEDLEASVRQEVLGLYERHKDIFTDDRIPAILEGKPVEYRPGERPGLGQSERGSSGQSDNREPDGRAGDDRSDVPEREVDSKPAKVENAPATAASKNSNNQKRIAEIDKELIGLSGALTAMSDAGANVGEIMAQMKGLRLEKDGLMGKKAENLPASEKPGQKSPESSHVDAKPKSDFFTEVDVFPGVEGKQKTPDEEPLTFEDEKALASFESQAANEFEEDFERLLGFTDELEDIAKSIGTEFGDIGNLKKVVDVAAPSLNPEKYERLKAQFEKAQAYFEKRAKEGERPMFMLLKTLHEKFGLSADTIRNLKPYIVRFMAEQNANSVDNERIIKTEAENGTERKEPDRDRADSDAAGHTGGVRDTQAGRESRQVRQSESESGSRHLSSDAPAGNEPGGDVGQAGSESVSGRERAGAPSVQDSDQSGNRVRPSERRDYIAPIGSLTRQGSWKQAAQNNLDAIELAKKIEDEDRVATTEEQATLAKFVGWGASELANNIFKDPDGYQIKADWKELATRLNQVMTPEEIATASRSTQYGHYTSEKVIRGIWSAIEQFGFQKGSILEPGMGIGLFAVAAPKSVIENSAYTGVEMDAMTARIAKLLLPDQAAIENDFIKQKIPKNHFDVAIGNPPFARTKILADREYKKYQFSLHDYFFAKSIDAVRPGGLMVFVTSRYTMDRKGDVARNYLGDRADLLGAIRLPQTAFQQNAGTEVVTDVLFFRKRTAGEEPAGEKWLGQGEITAKNSYGQDISGGVNEYFVAHPEMVLGEHSFTGKMRHGDNEYTVVPKAGDIEEQFQEAVKNLPKAVFAKQGKSQEIKLATAERDWSPTAKKEGSLYIKDGKLMVLEGGSGVNLSSQAKLSQKDEKWLADYVGLRDALKQAQHDQLTAETKGSDWEKSLADLNTAYDTFVKRHGNILAYTDREYTKTVDGNPVTTVSRNFKNEKLLSNDIENALVWTLEKVTDDGDIVKSAWLKQRTIKPPEPPKIESLEDALMVSLDTVGRLNIGHIAELIQPVRKMTEDDVISELGDLIYEEPGGGWLMADEYLSGNVKDKLEVAEAAASDPRYARNVEALQKVQPLPLPAEKITVQIGAAWVPTDVVADFAAEVLGIRRPTSSNYSNKAEPLVTFDALTHKWLVYGASGKGSQSKRSGTKEWGTEDRSPEEILEAALNSETVSIMATEAGPPKRTFVDKDAVAAVQAKIEKMNQAFKPWMFSEEKRAKAMTDLYNRKMNVMAEREYNGDHLTTPGLSLKFKLHPHVKRAIWRIIQTGNTYLAHAVGAGKTLEMIVSGMEQKRLGLISKPMYIVPNHMLKQFSSEFLEAYPLANIMVADEQNFHTDNRKRFVAQAALNDLDGVILTHSAFGLLRSTEESSKAVLDDLLSEMRDMMDALTTGTDYKGNPEGETMADTSTIKRLQQRIESIEQKFYGRMGGSRDNVLDFEQLGVDFLYVDEAHKFRKLDFVTNQTNLKGIDPSGSMRGLDLLVKSRWLEKQRPNRSMVLASGTPVTNTMAELYTIQRFLGHRDLIEDGLEAFDAWAKQFGEVEEKIEANAAGGYKPVKRFRKIVNTGVLMQRVRKFMDVLTLPQLAGLIQLPKIKLNSKGKPAAEVIVTEKYPELEEYLKGDLAMRILKSEAWKPSYTEKFNPDPMIAIIGDGQLAAFDMRFIDPNLPSNPASKLNRMIDGILDSYHAHNDIEYFNRDTGEAYPTKGAAHIVFSYGGFGDQVARNRGFSAKQWMRKRLVEGGIKNDEIAFIWDYKKSSAKQALFKEVREGKKKILIGGPENMGTGVNAQLRLKTLHYGMAPWYPADIEQPHGRIVRHGNQNKEVDLSWYAAKGTYDEAQWGMLSDKGKMIEDVMSGDYDGDIEDVTESSQYAMASALASGDPRALRYAELRGQVEKYNRLQQAFYTTQHSFDRQLSRLNSAWSGIPAQLEEISTLEKAIALVPDGVTKETFHLKIGDQVFDDAADKNQAEIGTALKEAWAKAVKANKKMAIATKNEQQTTIATVQGKLPILVSVNAGGQGVYSRIAVQFTDKLAIQLTDRFIADAGNGISEISESGLITRIKNAINDLPAKKTASETLLAEQRKEKADVLEALSKPFEYAEELEAARAEMNQLGLEMMGSGIALPAAGLTMERLKDLWDAYAINVAKKSMAKAVAGKTEQFEDQEVEPFGLKKVIDDNADVTDSAAFKKWFGDSKVVDENGEPFVVYHGGQSNIARFKLSANGLVAHFGTAEAANSKISEDVSDGIRSETGSNITPVYLSIQNPLRMKDVHFDEYGSFAEDLVQKKILTKAELPYPYKDRWDIESAKGHNENIKATVDVLKAKGYDGIVYRNHVEDPGSDSYIPFDPTQIKSAIGNKGTFDSDNPNILARTIDEEQEAADQMTVEEMRNLQYVPFDELLSADPQAELVRDHIKADARGHELFRRAFEEAKISQGAMKLGSTKAEDLFSGQFMEPEFVELTSEVLLRKWTEAKEKGYPTEQADILRRFAGLLNEAAYYNKGTAVVYVFDHALPHELFHQRDYMAAVEKTILNRHTDEYKQLLDEHPVSDKLWKKHFSKFSTYNRQKSLKVQRALLRSEIPPLLLELSDKQLKDFDVTPEERADYLLTWFKGYADKNGIDSLDTFDREEFHVQDFITKAKDATHAANEARKAGETNETDRRKQQEKEQSAGSRARPPSDRGRQVGIDEDELGDDRRLASLPSTMRRYGLEASDLAYDVFHDPAAQDEAERLLEELGVTGAMKFLRNMPAAEQDVQHALLSFMIQRMLIDYAHQLEATNPQEAIKQRNRALEFGREHSMQAVKAGRFTRAPQLIGQTVEGILYSIQNIVKDAYGEGKTLSPEKWTELEAAGRRIEQLLAKQQTLKKESQSKDSEIKKLKKQLDGEKAAKRPDASLARRRKLVEKIHQKHKPADFAALRDRLKERFKTPASLASVTGWLDRKIFARIAVDAEGGHYFVPEDRVEEFDAMTPAQRTAFGDELKSSGAEKTTKAYDEEFGGLKSAIEPEEEPFPVDDFAEVGAYILTQGLVSGREYLPKHFRAEMIGEFGDAIEPYFDEIYKKAWTLREAWLREARKDETFRRIRNAKKQNADLEDWEVEEILGERKEANQRRRAIEKMHELVSKGRKITNRKTEIDRLIADLAASDEIAVAASMQAIGMKPEAIYERLEKEFGVKTWTGQQDIFREAEKVRRKAQKQFEIDRDKIAQEIAKKEKEKQDIDDLRFEARADWKREQDAIAEEIRRIKSGAVKYTAAQVYDATNALRTLMASFDLSAALRQGGFFSFAHPALQAKAFDAMRKSFTEKGFGRVITEIETLPRFRQSRRMGIDYAFAGKIDDTWKGEELFRGRDFINHIPIAGWMIDKAITGWSERTYTAFLDMQRAVMYDYFASELEAAGFNTLRDKPAFEKMAQFVNVATGRGTLPKSKWGRLMRELPFFAPRYTLSRIQLLNMTLNPYVLYTLPPGARFLVIQSSARFQMTAWTIFYMAAAMGLSSLDPDDDDFMKIKVGTARYDIWAGELQPIKLFVKLGLAAYRGDRVPGERRHSMGHALERFFRGKLSPLAGLTWDKIAGEDYLGKEFSWKNAIGSRILPLTITDAIDAWKLEGGKGVAKTVPFAIFGVGVQNYKDRPEEPKTDAEKLAAKALSIRLAGRTDPDTEEDIQHREIVSQLTYASRMGVDIPALDEMVKDGVITEDQKRNILAAKNETYLESKAKKLTLEEFEAVLKEATPEEIERLRPMGSKKLKEAQVDGKLKPEQKERFGKLGIGILGDFPMPGSVKEEFDRIGIGEPDVGDSLTLRKRQPQTKLSFEQYDKYRRETLERIYGRVDELIKSETYQKADDSTKQFLIQRMMRKAREQEQKQTKRELLTQP